MPARAGPAPRPVAPATAHRHPECSAASSCARNQQQGYKDGSQQHQRSAQPASRRTRRTERPSRGSAAEHWRGFGGGHRVGAAPPGSSTRRGGGGAGLLPRAARRDGRGCGRWMAGDAAAPQGTATGSGARGGAGFACWVAATHRGGGGGNPAAEPPGRGEDVPSSRDRRRHHGRYRGRQRLAGDAPAPLVLRSRTGAANTSPSWRAKARHRRARAHPSWRAKARHPRLAVGDFKHAGSHEQQGFLSPAGLMQPVGLMHSIRRHAWCNLCVFVASLLPNSPQSRLLANSVTQAPKGKVHHKDSKTQRLHKVSAKHKSPQRCEWRVQVPSAFIPRRDTTDPSVMPRSSVVPALGAGTHVFSGNCSPTPSRCGMRG